ncbi:VOC family protein [Corynebacterium sp. H78]|uniref:VOC family protein n=1 Tax=Corynebacterium sp. H78 TaxID=3133417 RepID=UPI0030B6642B
MINATPYIGFTGQAEEALNFYASVFGGTPNTLPWSNMGSDNPGIMHGHLVTDAGWDLMAADNPEHSDDDTQQRVTICVWGDDTDAMVEQFNALAEGGTVTMPLEPQAWGAMFGGLKDRFGVDWGFNVEPKKAD